MKRISILILSLLIISASSSIVPAQGNEKICTLYFTYIGCPNCAHTDPIVLTEWTRKYPDLVVIEYMWPGGDWKDPNSQFFGEYAQRYKTHAAVPQLCIDRTNIKVGGLDIPKAEEDIKTKEFNPCPLLDRSVSFAELNLGKLKGKPKLWANERILISLGDNDWLFQWNGKEVYGGIAGDEEPDNRLLKDLLFADNISKALKGKEFEGAEPQKAEFSGVAFPGSGFVPFAEFAYAIKVNLSEAQTAETPIVIEPTEPELPTQEIIEIPLIGKIKIEEFSLPILTIILAIVDGLTNPCGFFVLFFLLAALLSLAGARKRMLLVGGIFVLFFALYYFLFMAILLNVFIMGREIAILTIIAGAICIIAGIINIKDYFFFQKGISFSLSKSEKLKFTERVKNLSLAKSTSAVVIGTIILASTISLIAIACTFGIPLAYTKLLTSKDLPYAHYYLYLIFYNLIYIIPMAIIVSIFAITLGGKRFSEVWIRRLKLVSGFIILLLGLVLVWNHTLLENISILFEIISLAILVSGLIIFIDWLMKKRKIAG